MTVLENRVRLTISCNDQPGIVAKISQFLAQRGANITELAQHSTDPFGGMFFSRLEFELPNLAADIKIFDSLCSDFKEQVASAFNIEFQMIKASTKKKVAIMVSKFDHALMELLWRYERGELDMDLKMVISNHPDLSKAVSQFGIPFYHLPIIDKASHDRELLKLLKNEDIQTVVLARYMQIISPTVLEQYPYQMINIHHSFLPAFVGASPYHQAYDKGVKLIGATAHFVTNNLDEGPIIEQDVKRITHFMNVEELKALGHTIEREVLFRALRWFLEDRVIVYNHKTLVFE